MVVNGFLFDFPLRVFEGIQLNRGGRATGVGRPYTHGERVCGRDDITVLAHRERVCGRDDDMTMSFCLYAAARGA
jgi:hypothetical protein